MLYESNLHNTSTDLSSLDDGTFAKLAEQFYDEKVGNLTVRDLKVLSLKDFIDEFSENRCVRMKLKSWIIFYNLVDKFGAESLY